MKTLVIFFSLVFLCLPTLSSPLKPVRLDSPKSTMKSYLEAMGDYKKGIKNGDPSLLGRVQDATRTMDTSKIPALIRDEKSKEAAILLKEVLDRVIIVDLEKVPDDADLKRWRLKDTEITIRKVTEGPREGDFVFDAETVVNIPGFYKRVKDLN